MAKPTNPRIDELVKPLIDKALEDAATTAATTAETKAKEAAAVASGASTPATAAFAGQLFVKTGENAGIYISTGTTTPGWTLVAEKNV